MVFCTGFGFISVKISIDLKHKFGIHYHFPRYPSLNRTNDDQQMSLVLRKPVFGVSDHVPHKPGCAATEDSQKLEILYLGSRGIVLAM